MIWVNVVDKVFMVEPEANWHLGAIATDARWQAGYGETSFAMWEIRDADGVLLDPKAMPGDLKALNVNPKTGKR